MRVEQKLTKEIYNMMKDWWLGNNFQVVSPSILPQTTFVCYNDDDVPIYTMCFYHTDSNLAWVGWQLKNPDPEVNRAGGLEYLFKVMEDYAIHCEYQVMFTTSNTPPVEKILKEREFNIGDEKVNHYTKSL